MEALVLVLIVALVGGGLVALIWALVVYSAKFAQRIDATWAHAATLVGGRFVPSHGPWYNKKARNVEARIGGMAVLADHYTVSTGKSSTTYTRVASEALAPPGLALQLYRKHALSGLGDALGFQDVPTGHGGFDEAFTVKSNAPELVPVWLGPEVRNAVAAASDYGLWIKDGVVRARRVGLEDEAEQLAGVMRAVALLAGRGGWLLEHWRRLASQLGGSVRAQHSTWTADAATSIQAAWRDIPVSIDVITQREGVLGGDLAMTTRVRARRSRGEGFCFGAEEVPRGWQPVERKGCRLGMYSQNPEQTRHRLSDEVVALIGRVRPVYVEATDDHITLLIYGVLVDADLAAAAMELVGRLASEHQLGPYR